MLCEICRKQFAAVTRMIDDGYGERKRAVCLDCARKKDSEIKDSGFSDFFWGKQAEVVRCKVCGRTKEQILKTSYVGCYNCYKEFGRDIEELVYQIHGGTSHVGKVPLTRANDSDYSDSSSMMARALDSGDSDLARLARNHFPGRRGE